jgi:serine/threonine protein kinase
MDESLGHDSDEVSGTPSYMAPEQAQLKSHRLSAATDIYGLGAIGFEMLTGQPPFRGESPHQTLLRVVGEPAPRLRDGRPWLPADLEALHA